MPLVLVLLADCSPALLLRAPFNEDAQIRVDAQTHDMHASYAACLTLLLWLLQ